MSACAATSMPACSRLSKATISLPASADASKVNSTFTYPKGAMGANSFSDVTSEPFTMSGCPVALSMRVPLTV